MWTLELGPGIGNWSELSIEIWDWVLGNLIRDWIMGMDDLVLRLEFRMWLDIGNLELGINDGELDLGFGIRILFEVKYEICTTRIS